MLSLKVGDDWNLLEGRFLKLAEGEGLNESILCCGICMEPSRCSDISQSDKLTILDELDYWVI